MTCLHEQRILRWSDIVTAIDSLRWIGSLCFSLKMNSSRTANVWTNVMPEKQESENEDDINVDRGVNACERRAKRQTRDIWYQRCRR